MARHIALLKFAEQRAMNVRNSTLRARAFNKLAPKAGVKLDGQ